MSRFALPVVACLLFSARVSGAAEPHPSVRFDGDRVSVDVQQLPLTELIDGLARGAGLAIDWVGDPSPIRVSDSFARLDAVQALRRMLSPHSHLLLDYGTVGARRHITVILIGTAGGAMRSTISSARRAPASVATPDTPVETLIAEATSFAPAAERGAAAEAIAYRPGDDEHSPDYAEPVLRQMLADSDEAVRGRALEILKDTADRVPFDVLAQVAREDASPARRIQALELLVERSENGESRQPLRIALADPDAEVRARARELVEDWHVAVDGA